MPDLGTHLLAGYWLHRVAGKRVPCDLPLLLVGCVLPDVVARALAIVFNSLVSIVHASPAQIMNAYWFLALLHTPASLAFQCAALAFLFERENRAVAFLSLLAGAAMHLAFDLFQYNLSRQGHFWLFPFSDRDVGIALFPVTQWPFVFIGAVAVVAVTVLAQYRHGKRSSPKTGYSAFRTDRMHRSTERGG